MAGIYGIQVYESDIETVWNGKLRSSGAAWVRGRALWSAIEPADTTPRTRNWSATDSLIGGIGNQGFRGLVDVYRSPDWAASTPCGAIDRVPLTRYMAFWTDLVERYDADGHADAPGAPRIDAWEIGNEPDFAPSEAGSESDYGSCFGDDAPAYGATLRAAYSAIKAADPTALVVFGAVAYDRFADNPDYTANQGPFRFNFVRDVLTWLTANHGSEAGYPFFDVMAFHNYNDFRTYWDGHSSAGPEIVAKADHLRQHQLQVPGQFDLRGVPVFADEVGIISAPSDPYTDRSEAYQSAYVGQVFARSLAAGLSAAVWYTAEDNQADPSDCGNPYAWNAHGLLRSTWVRGQADLCAPDPLPGYNPTTPHEEKPAFVAFHTFATAIGDATFDRRISDSETGSSSIEAWRVTRADGLAALVAFTDNGQRLGRHGVAPPPTRSLTVDASKLPGWTGRVRVTDHLGVSRVESGSSVTVLVDWRPTYLAVEP